MSTKAPLATVFAAAILFGCKGADDEYEPAVVPKTVAFEGNVDPKYAGNWKSADGMSALDLAPDGTVEIQTVTNSVNGRSTSRVSGKWLASGDRLTFQYADSSKASTVVGYTTKLANDTLILQGIGGQLKTTYRRK